MWSLRADSDLNDEFDFELNGPGRESRGMIGETPGSRLAVSGSAKDPDQSELLSGGHFLCCFGCIYH